MNVGMGGTDVSLGTIAQSIAGLDAWRVNAELWTSKELEAHKYASALRTLYSVGGAAEKALYEELLSGKTNIEVNRDGAYSAKTEANGDGTKTIYIGSEALAKGSRFGMNILLAHEAYRNGIDDGEAGQREETDRAVLGHIGAAYALGQTYGIGAIGEALGKEVATYLTALSTGNMDDLARLLSSYDASGDYWRLRKDGSLEYDGRATLTDEEGNVLMSYQQMGLRSDNSIEGALAFLLTGKNDEAGAALARRYMIEAGMEHTNKGRPVNEWRWKDGDKGAITLANMGKRIHLFDKIHTIGTTMVPQLFAGLFDYQTDVQASYVLRTLDPTKGLADQRGLYEVVKTLEGMRHAVSGGFVPISLGANTGLRERYNNLLEAKVNFYLSRTVPMDGEIYVSTEFGEENQNYWRSTEHKHVGGDFVERDKNIIAGKPIKFPFNGKVIKNDGDGKKEMPAGYYTQIEYGYRFEGVFISQHVFSNSMHLNAPGILTTGCVYRSGTVLGYVGNTGDSTGPHLHQEYFIKHKIDSKEERLKYDLMFGNWNKGIFEGDFLSKLNSYIFVNNRTYVNPVLYWETIHGSRLKRR